MRPNVACVGDCRKIWSMSQDKPFVRKSQWKQLVLAQKFGAVGPQRITRLVQTVWPRLMVSQIWYSPTGFVGEGAAKEECPLPTLLSGRKLPPSGLPWCWIIHLLPICLWCLSICCPSTEAQREWVWISSRVELPGTPEDSVPSASIPTGFYNQKLWGFPYQH